MKVYIVMYEGFDSRTIEQVFRTYESAEAYILTQGGWHSETHHYTIEEEEVH